jgi:hypothetical protein
MRLLLLSLLFFLRSRKPMMEEGYYYIFYVKKECPPPKRAARTADGKTGSISLVYVRRTYICTRSGAHEQQQTGATYVL